MEYLRIAPHTTILVLNSSYEPINFTNWKRAVILLLKEKAHVISDRVIRLVNYVKIPISRILSYKPSRSLIYKRDHNTCQYCGATKKLTIDHVIPKSRGGGDTWENMVVACSSCNIKKSDMLLEHTNMKLLKKPKAPYNNVVLHLYESNIPQWKEYVYNVDT